MPLPEETTTNSQVEAEANTTETLSRLELGAPGSIEANVRVNLEIFKKYLHYSGILDDQCSFKDIFSETEESRIRGQPGESSRGEVCLQILLDKGEPALEKFVEILDNPDNDPDINYEHLRSLFKAPLASNKDLVCTLQTEQRYEEAINRPEHSLSLLRVIHARLQREGFDAFIRGLQGAGVIKVGEMWKAFVSGLSLFDQAIAVLDKAVEQFGLKRLVAYSLGDPKLTENGRKSLSAIEALATKASVDSPATPEASPSSKVTREDFKVNFYELVSRIDSRRFYGYSRGIFSKADLERMEAKFGKPNRARAYLLPLLAADQSIVEKFTEALGVAGYHRLLLCLNRDSGMIGKLWAERRHKKLVDQYYLDMVGVLASQMEAGSEWPVGARAGLPAFCYELKAEGIIELGEDWELDELTELAELSSHELARRVLAKSWEQLRLEELVRFLEKKLTEKLERDAQSPPDANLVAGLKLVSEIITKAGSDSLPSDIQCSEKEMSLVQEILNSGSASVFQRLDLELLFDHCVGSSDRLLLENLQALFLGRFRLFEFASGFTGAIKGEAELRILCDALKKSEQIDAIVASQNPDREERREAASKELTLKRNIRLTSLMIADESLVCRSYSVGLITEYDREKLLDMQKNRIVAAGAFLDLVELRCSDDVIKRLGGILREACQPVAAGYLADANYKDEIAERFNQNLKKNSTKFSKRAEEELLDRPCYLNIVDRCFCARIISWSRASKLKRDVRSKGTHSDRLGILRSEVFVFLDSTQICSVVEIIKAERPKLGEAIMTDDIRELKLRARAVTLGHVVMLAAGNRIIERKTDRAVSFRCTWPILELIASEYFRRLGTPLSRKKIGKCAEGCLKLQTKFFPSSPPQQTNKRAATEECQKESKAKRQCLSKISMN